MSNDDDHNDGNSISMSDTHIRAYTNNIECPNIQQCALWVENVPF